MWDVAHFYASPGTPRAPPGLSLSSSFHSWLHRLEQRKRQGAQQSRQPPIRPFICGSEPCHPHKGQHHFPYGPGSPRTHPFSSRHSPRPPPEGALQPAVIPRIGLGGGISPPYRLLTHPPRILSCHHTVLPGDSGSPFYRPGTHIFPQSLGICEICESCTLPTGR